MTNFPLLHNLQTPSKKEQPLLPHGHKYQQYNVNIENEEFVVHIPLRECETFEQMVNIADEITLEEFNRMLRKVRGIRG